MSASAQALVQVDAHPAQGAPHLGDVPRVPGVGTFWRGINAGLTFSSVHDSSIGWYTVATPAVSYTFSPHYSADVSFSVYPNRRVESRAFGPVRQRQFDVDVGDIGDVFIGFHAGFNPRGVRSITTALVTAPSGDTAAGLGAGKFTYDFSQHFDRYFKQTGFLLDVGAGNSSGLVNRLMTNDYTSVGGLVHAEAGFVSWLYGSNYIQSVFYEQHPIGNQTLYYNPAPTGFPTQNVVVGQNVGEDNGVITSVGIPVTDHIMISGYYSRSFQQHVDTVSIGATWVLRPLPRIKRLSLIDKALREAETIVEENSQPPDPATPEP